MSETSICQSLTIRNSNKEQMCLNQKEDYCLDLTFYDVSTI